MYQLKKEEGGDAKLEQKELLKKRIELEAKKIREQI